MDTRGYQAYKQQAVNTMTRGEMLILLYDELSKRLTRAKFALENHEDVLFTQSVNRSKEIVNYLSETLNFKYPVSRDLKRMYDFFLFELARLEAGKRVDVIADLQSLIKELRDAFDQASRNTNM